MSSLTLADAKKLCTASELRLATCSVGSRLERLDAAALKKNVAEARKLRDKWRDQATAQRRGTQRAQGSRASDKNARSQQKAQLFEEVLGRYANRLAQVEASPELAGTLATPAKASPTKRQRSQGHRASRASVRGALREKQQMLEAAGKSAPAKAKKTAKKSVKKSAKKPASPAAEPAEAAPPKKKSAKKTAPPQPAITSLKPSDAAPANPAKNRAAKAAAKQARLQKSGVTSRLRGHVSARTRKQQSKRDNRD